MQFIPLLFVILVSILTLTLVVVAFNLVRVLGQLHRFFRSLNEVVDTSTIKLTDILDDSFTQLLNKVELREELIEDLAIRSASPGKKPKKKSQPKQLFRGL